MPRLYQKSGSVTIEPLWIHNFIPKIRKIVGAVFKLSCNERMDERTDEWMDETDFIDPSIFREIVTCTLGASIG